MQDEENRTETPTGAENDKPSGKRRSTTKKPATATAVAPGETKEEAVPEFFRVNPKELVALLAPFASVSKTTAHESHRSVRFTPSNDGLVVSATNFETWLFRKIPGIKWTADVNVPLDVLLGTLKLLGDVPVECSINRSLTLSLVARPSIDSFICLHIKCLDPLACHQFDDTGFEDAPTTLTATQIRQLNESFGYVVEAERPLAGGKVTNAYNQFQLVLGGTMDEIDLPSVVLNLAAATFVDLPITMEVNAMHQRILLTDGTTTVVSYYMGAKRPNFDTVRNATVYWQANVDRKALIDAMRFVQLNDILIVVRSDGNQLIFAQDGFQCVLPVQSGHVWEYRLNAKSTIKALGTMETSLVDVSLVRYPMAGKEQTAWRIAEPGSDIVHFTGAIPVGLNK